MVSINNKEPLILEFYDDNKVKISPILGAFAFTSSFYKYVKLNENKTYDVIIDLKKYNLIEHLVKENKKLYEFIISFNSDLYVLEKIDPSLETGFQNLALHRRDDAVDIYNYKSLNPDLMKLSDEDVIYHFKNFAKKEKRLTCFFSKIFMQLTHELIAKGFELENTFLFGNDFNGRNNSHKNILEIGNNSKKSFMSYKNEVKSPLLLSFHAYYKEEIYHYLPIIKEAYNLGYQIHVSLPLEQNNFFKLTDLLEFNPFVSYVENIGRDIFGHYAAVKNFNYQNYFNLDALLILHTKKSVHVNEEYRKYWIKSLTGWMLEKDGNKTLLEIYTKKITQNKVSQVAGAACRCVGLDGLPKSFFKNYYGCENWPFVSGTMSLISGDVVRNTLMKYTYEDFLNNPVDSQKLNMEGGLPHVVERQLSYEAYIQNGIKWL